MPDKDEIAFYLRTGHGTKLPWTEETEVRFAVMNKNGMSSNTWKVWTTSEGDAYIVCRDSMQEYHVSLHHSGQQHFRYDPHPNSPMASERALWDKWREPPFYGRPDTAPSFQLLFPSWAFAIPYSDRQLYPKIWNRNRVLVETNEQNPVTVVGFYILDADVDFRFDDPSASAPMAILPLPRRPNRRLWVVVSQIPEGNLGEVVQRAVVGINARGLPEERFQGLEDGHLLSSWMTAPTEGGGRYSVVVPLDLHRVTRE